MAFTKEQEKAISSQARAVLVVAGPGSGKTTVLTERLVYLLQNAASAESCLLLSFTRASSKERAFRGVSPFFNDSCSLPVTFERRKRSGKRESCRPL